MNGSLLACAAVYINLAKTVCVFISPSKSPEVTISWCTQVLYSICFSGIPISRRVCLFVYVCKHCFNYVSVCLCVTSAKINIKHVFLLQITSISYFTCSYLMIIFEKNYIIYKVDSSPTICFKNQL